MANPKLIVIEGIPGSGKTSTAAFIQKWLAAAQVPNRLYLEGDPDHPADFEFMAYFRQEEWVAFVREHPTWKDQLEQAVEGRGQDRFINYQKLSLSNRNNVPADIVDALAKRDVYEVPAAHTYCRLARERWQAFAASAQAGSETYIFECCLMQNPLAVLTLKHNWAYPDTLQHIAQILEAIHCLDPVILYLYQRDPQRTFQRIAAERPQEWLDYVIAYTERGAWSKANGRRGYQSFIDYHIYRQAAEIEFLRRTELPHLVLADPELDWEHSHAAITAYLRTMMDRGN